METSDRFVHPQSESPPDSLQDGDSSVGAPVCKEWRLDGVSRLEGCVFASPIHLDSCKHLRFVALNQVFQFKALCFGLSTAPQVFTWVMAPV